MYEIAEIILKYTELHEILHEYTVANVTYG
jgi:hypothetical protein